MNRKMVCRIERSILFFAVTLILIFSGACFISGRMDASKVNASEEYQSYKYYTSVEVKTGDSLWSIAGTYRTAEYHDVNEYIREVKEINHLTGDDIHAGAYLTVPYYSSQYL